MKKLIKFWTALWYILQRPALLNYILKDEALLGRQFKRTFPEVQLKEIDAFNWPEAAQITVRPYAFLSGSSMLTDFAFLQLLCKKFSVETYFEIGTWRGESAANVAPYVQNVYTLNLPDENLKALGQSKAYIDSHRFFSREVKNVTHLFGDSAHFDFRPYEQVCDLVFIDGDHSTEAVLRDTQTALKLRKSKTSILVWHDAKSDAEYPRYEVLLGIYKALPKEMHAHVYLVKHALCAVYLPQVEAAEFISLNALPSKTFEVTLHAKKLNESV
ncbi:MAG: class I SAM-dependent methyltransferase [Flavobacteriales bacterium]